MRYLAPMGPIFFLGGGVKFGTYDSPSHSTHHSRYPLFIIHTTHHSRYPLFIIHTTHHSRYPLFIIHTTHHSRYPLFITYILHTTPGTHCSSYILHTTPGTHCSSHTYYTPLQVPTVHHMHTKHHSRYLGVTIGSYHKHEPEPYDTAKELRKVSSQSVLGMMRSHVRV